MQRFMAYAILLYAFVFLMGMNFFLIGLQVDLFGPELLIIGLITVLPAILLAIYKFRANLGNLEAHEKALRLLVYFFLVLAIIIVSIVVIPTIYS